MLGAELIDLMMNFVGDPKLLIVFCVIEDGLIDKLLSKFVHNFDSVKIDKSAVGSTTWNIIDGIGLNGDLHFDEFFNERQLEVETWFSELLLQDSKLFVNANIAFFDLMESNEHSGSVYGNTDKNEIYNCGHNFVRYAFKCL
jgi:hypothetical protein